MDSYFLGGFRFAEDYHGLGAEARLGGFDVAEFEQWVVAKYNPRHLSHNSFTLAESLAGSDEAGFDLWFSWFDEYRQVR